MTPKHHAGVFSDAQLISVLLVLAGVLGLVLLRRRKGPSVSDDRVTMRSSKAAAEN